MTHLHLARYRRSADRVERHPGEAVLAGGFGMVFGTGADRQTYVTSDGNQFRDAATAYVAAPEPL